MWNVSHDRPAGYEQNGFSGSRYLQVFFGDRYHPGVWVCLGAAKSLYIIIIIFFPTPFAKDYPKRLIFWKGFKPPVGSLCSSFLSVHRETHT